MFVLAFALLAICITLLLVGKILTLLFFFFLFDIFFYCLSFSPFLPVCPIGQAFFCQIISRSSNDPLFRSLSVMPPSERRRHHGE